MLEQLKKEVKFLDSLSDTRNKDSIRNRRDELRDLIDDIERSGITRDAQEMDDGKLYVEFPASPLPDLREFERMILTFLGHNQPMESTSALARELGTEMNVSPDSDDFTSFRSKVQYNVDKLEKKGYIRRQEENNRYRTRLSVTGELWVKTHANTDVQDDERRELST